MNREKSKQILSVAISLAIGFGTGFVVKDFCDKSSADASEPAK